MTFKEQVLYIRRHMKKNRLRVFMTILATTMGTAFLIVLASIGFGLHETAEREILSNANITEVKVWADQMEEKDIQKISQLPGVHTFAQRSRVTIPDSVYFNEIESNGELELIDYDIERQLDFKLKEGRFPETDREVVVGYHFGESFVDGEKKDVLGKAIQYVIPKDGEEEDGERFEDTFTIVGIKEAPAREWNSDSTIFVSRTYQPQIMDVYKQFEPDEEMVDSLFYNDYAIHAKSAEVVKDLKAEIEALGYSTYSVLDEIEQFDLFFTAFKMGLVFVGTIAVLIASIGIFNTMTMAVTERTREIGVMKALGMSPKLIQRLFIMESAWIGVLGTAIAIVISYGVSFLANQLLPLILEFAMKDEGVLDAGITFSTITLPLILIASTISIAVAIISGFRPAKKATKIDIIEAMRTNM